MTLAVEEKSVSFYFVRYGDDSRLLIEFNPRLFRVQSPQSHAF